MNKQLNSCVHGENLWEEVVTSHKFSLPVKKAYWNVSENHLQIFIFLDITKMYCPGWCSSVD